MGDKHRSEIPKPVKNTLLSGANHGFPFDSFQGSSLLIPVSQDSPSILQDVIEDEKLIKNASSASPENVVKLSGEMETVALEEKQKINEAKTSSLSSSQGYSGIFSSFFGYGSQSKQQDVDFAQNKDISSKPPSVFINPTSSSLVPDDQTPSKSLTPNVPSVQSFSPVLQVSSSTSSQQSPVEFSSSSDFTREKSQEQSWSSQFYGASPSMPTPSESTLFQPVEFSESTQGVSVEIQSRQDNIQAHSIGFESFNNLNPAPDRALPVLTKAKSAFELPVATNSEFSTSNTSPFFSPSQIPPVSTTSSPTLYQVRAGSVDSFKPIQIPPLSGSPFSHGPSFPGAPPLSSGTSSRNYRRDHHKRLTYAPVPGLTSNVAVSSSYLQSAENFSGSSSFSSEHSSPFSRPPLSTSVSQPILNLSSVSSDSHTSGVSTSRPLTSLHNFFIQTSTPPSSTIQSKFNSVEALPASTVLSTIPISNSPTVCFSSMVFNNTITQTTPFLPPSLHTTSGNNVVDSVAVRPPIMSTKEQPGISGFSQPSGRAPSPSVIPSSFNNLANLGTSGIIYRPAYHHWFVKFDTKDGKEFWQPFSMTDSLALEAAFNSVSLTPETVVPTDGGRYDVNVTNRMRHSVYWDETPKTVRRCSWFYKSTTESRLHPFDENTAYNLEEEYKKAVKTSTWHSKVNLPNGDSVVMYGPSSMALYQSALQPSDGWEAETEFTESTSSTRGKIVKRGVLDELEIEDGEPPAVDHLVFVVHGIGSVCDLKWRTIEEAGTYRTLPGVRKFGHVPGRDKIKRRLTFCVGSTGVRNRRTFLVDGFRSRALQLLKSHFRVSMEQGLVNRIEILPVSWHGHLHGEATGLDKKLQTITLKSIPRLRHFTNDTLLDILFYTSPVYCQNIMQQVGREINTLYDKFKRRNPSFKGGVSLVGHSLGSLILFDMLCHQKPAKPSVEEIEEVETKSVLCEVPNAISPGKKRHLSRNVSYVVGIAGTGQPYVQYPQLSFQPFAFFALGSPIGMFVTVRGIDSLGLDFYLPTCSRFFNIFHPFDPVAYRMEALINSELAEERPILIPHHKGRKRMHLELKETMARIGADLKQRLVDSVRSTWNTVYQLTTFGRADDGLEQEVDKVIEKQLERQRAESASQCLVENDDSEFNAGRLNQGRRIDYVLQEAPLESFNEYVSALTSHVIYWDSEDTLLLMLTEIYSSMGVIPDTRMPGNNCEENGSASSSTHFNPLDLPSTSTAHDKPNSQF